MKKILLYKLYSFLAIENIVKIKLHGLLDYEKEFHISFESVWQLPIESTTSDGNRPVTAIGG